jgi:steroid delta-isomerase-like uncharacterized protein
MSNSAIARRFFDEIWSAGHFELVDELIAPDYIGHPTAPEQTVHGPEGVKQYIARLREGIPDLAVTVDDQLACGEKVATRWTAHGTHDGDLMGLGPTGRSATVTGITVQRIQDGRQIAEGWTSWDALGLFQQLGAAPEGATR